MINRTIKRKKRKGGIATIIITLVLVIICLVSIPLYKTFSKDAALQVEKGNKAAGTRARKASLELEKLMKEFRKVSVEAGKN